MTAQINFVLTDEIKKLGKTLDNVSKQAEVEINQAIKETAYAAYASIVAKAQAELNSTRQDYLKALHIQELGDNSYVISLDGNWPNMVEGGYASFNMTPYMLASQKMVEVGRRSGEPWVQHTKPKGKNKESHKFAYVPFERQPFSKAPKQADMAAAIREMTGVNRLTKQEQKLTQIFKDDLGNPMEGLVAVGRSENKLVDGLAKYQKTYTNSETGKQTTQSVYINYRAVSEIGKPWIKPSWDGLQAFEAAAAEVSKQIDSILKALL